MLRRLRIWFARLLTGQGEHERLSRLLATLRAAGVTAYESEGLKLQLEPVRPAQEAPAMPKPVMLSDAELLYGESEAELRKQGLI